MKSVSVCVLVLCVVAAVQAQFNRAPAVTRTETLVPSGAFESSYLTPEGIRVVEKGRLVKNALGEDVLVKEGNYAYTSPEGVPVAISYIADEYGFRAAGANLP